MNTFSSRSGRLRRAMYLGLGISVLVHAVVLSVLVLSSLHAWRAKRPVAVIGVSPPYSTHSTESNDGDANAIRIVDSPEQVTAGLLSSKIADAVANAEQLSYENQLGRLDNLGDDLNRLTNGDSLDEMEVRLHELLGLTPRAEEPDLAADVEVFDFNTAQLHDVRREEAETEHRFVGVLIDAHGCLFEVELTPAEGKTLFEMMERIKSNPLLERIYRRIAMPLLDQLIQAHVAAAETAAEAEAADSVVGDKESADGTVLQPYVERLSGEQ